MAVLADLLESLCLGDGGSVHFVFGSMLYVRCCHYMRLTVLIVAADIFGYLVWISVLRACLMVHAGRDLIFLMVIFVYVGYLIHLDGC